MHFRPACAWGEIRALGHCLCLCPLCQPLQPLPPRPLPQPLPAGFSSLSSAASAFAADRLNCTHDGLQHVGPKAPGIIAIQVSASPALRHHCNPGLSFAGMARISSFCISSCLLMRSLTPAKLHCGFGRTCRWHLIAGLAVLLFTRVVPDACDLGQDVETWD